MATIQINLDDKKIEELQHKADEFGLTTQDLVQAAFDDLLSQPEEEITHAINHILSKNKELYKRLAK